MTRFNYNIVHLFPMIKTTILTMTILIAGVIAPAINNTSVFAASGFAGDYDPANWTLTNSNADGYVDTSGAPGSILLVGGDNNSFGAGNTDYTITVACGGDISFDWTYQSFDRDGPAFDPAGYIVNAGVTQLSNNGGPSIQSGTTTVTVSDGDTFGYRIHTVDNILGRGAFTTITNLRTPECNATPTANDDTNETLEDTSVSGTVTGSDDDGDTLTFSLETGPSNGIVELNSDGTYTYTPNLNYNGIDSFTFVVNDGQVDSLPATVIITVTAVNDAPLCRAPTIDTSSIWPPNHKMVPITVNMATTDVDGDLVTVSVSSIFQDEPTNGLGDGDTSPDATLAPAQVRAERSGTGDGRVYIVTVTADDGNDGTCSGTVQVNVPHSMKKSLTVVNSGTIYDSTIP
jgi:hypothetical protein